MITSAVKKLFFHSHYIAIGIIVSGIFLRISYIGRTLGGGDESQVLLEWVYRPIEHIITTYSHGSGGHHIFHSICLRLMVLLFGEENPLAIRFPAFFASICYLLMLYKTTSIIFDSKPIAQLSLFGAALNPIHIYYSQTARGYSFVMLFSILTLYATLKLNKNYDNSKWGSVFVVSMIFLIYTVPTGILFFVSFAGWLIWIVICQHLKNLTPSLIFFNGVKPWIGRFLLIVIFVFLLYLPNIKQMYFEYQYHSFTVTPYENRFEIFKLFFPRLIHSIFPGYLVIFSPFVVLGIKFAVPKDNNIRSLLILLLLLPFLFSFSVGTAWYPRAYLFIHSIIIIFFSAGSIWAFNKIKNFLGKGNICKIVSVSFSVLFSWISINYIFNTLFNQFNKLKGLEYTNSVKQNALLNDLILLKLLLLLQFYA